MTGITPAPASDRWQLARAAGAFVAAGLILSAMIWAASPLTYQVAAIVMPNATGDERALTALFTLLLYGGIGIVAVLAAMIDGINAAKPGPRPLRSLGEGAAIGIGAMVVTIAISMAGGVASPAASAGVSGALLFGIVLTLVQAGGEELYFRGWVQPVMTRAIGPLGGMLITAILFAGLHLLGEVRDALSLANLFLGGLLFGALRWRTGGIVAPVAAHFLWNMLEDQLFGLTPNPGAGPFGAALDLDLTGPWWLGGSAEGLNSSIATTAGLLVALGVVVVLGLRRSRRIATPRSS